MNAAFICECTRTPIGRFGGALASVRPDNMLAHVIKAVIEKTPGLDPAAIDDVIIGCANQAGEDNRNVGRMAVLLYSCRRGGEHEPCPICNAKSRRCIFAQSRNL